MKQIKENVVIKTGGETAGGGFRKVACQGDLYQEKGLATEVFGIGRWKNCLRKRKIGRAESGEKKEEGKL